MAVTDRVVEVIVPDGIDCLSSVQLPQLSLNGTGKDQLVEQHMQVVDALRLLRLALLTAFPHYRDYQYYPQYSVDARETANKELDLVALMAERHELIIGHLVQG